MKNKLKKLFFITLATLMVLTVSPLSTQVLADDEYLQENVELTLNGMECMVDFRSDYTASIWQVKNTSNLTAWTMPETIEYEIEGC